MTDPDWKISSSAATSAKHRLIADLATPRLSEAVALYFDRAQPFAGKTFDALGHNPPHEITSDDLLAVTLLDVRWSPLAVRSLLIDRAAAVGELLSKIDTDTDLWDGDAAQQLKHVDPLWELLCGLPGVCDTRASKLLARKRPRLIPITDSKHMADPAGLLPGQAVPPERHGVAADEYRGCQLASDL